MQINAMVPELAVTDCSRSLAFYCDVLGFEIAYERPEEGFAFLARGAVQLMIDQIDRGRTFVASGASLTHPYGRGINLRIGVEDIDTLLARLDGAGVTPFTPLEEKWYRAGALERGQRQFVVADPDGYLLRLCETLGVRSAP